jgi:sugar phosphate isomerase/epimerase
LRAAGTHVYIDALLGDKLQSTIQFNRILGNEFLIVPWLPEERRRSKEEWLETARLMNAIAKKLKAEGMRVGYHNHAIEFYAIDGELPWNVFFNATTPDVMMQLDTGNAMQAGISPEGILEIIKKYPGRAATVHVKEFSSKNERALIGEGEMKWQGFLKLCASVGGTEWYIIEQETCAFPRLECARQDIANLRKMLR